MDGEKYDCLRHLYGTALYARQAQCLEFCEGDF
jgi:hypothetical protein